MDQASIKSLKASGDLYITKPDEGSGVLILDGQNYTNKMETSLCDSPNFVNLILLTFVMVLVELR